MNVRQWWRARRANARRISDECARIDKEVGSRLDDMDHAPITDEQAQRIIDAAIEAARRDARRRRG